MTTLVVNTCNDILDWLKLQAQIKAPIDPLLYLEAAEKLNALIGDETDKLIDLDHIVANVTLEYMNTGMSGVKARAMTEASNAYRDMKKQLAKIERIKEAIRLAKLHARLKSEELRSS